MKHVKVTVLNFFVYFII